VIPIGDYRFTDDDRAAINRVVDSGRISEHKEVRAFEDEFADYVGTKYCVAVSSGTAALICGLAAMTALEYIKPSANVLIPALTFIATANAVVLTGHKPIFSDVENLTFSMGPYEITDDIDLVLPVHLLGYTAPMGSIMTKAKMVGALVAEDAAEAHGAKHFGAMAGSMGLWSAFSFYIAHTVQAGELGAVCTDDRDLALAVRSIKAHGRVCTCRVCTRSSGGCPHKDIPHPRFASSFIGYNFKTMEFQAALARNQLAGIDENIYARKYNERALEYGFRSLNGKFINPHYSRYGPFRTVPMAYPIVLTHTGIRDRVMAEIESNGVECRPLFNCIPTRQLSYKWHPQALDIFPVSEYYGDNGFYIGCHQYLSDSDIGKMVSVCCEAIERISNE